MSPRSLLILPTLILACDGKPAADANPPVVADSPAAQPERPSPTSEHPVGKEVVATMDPSTDPCVDFYQYACGGWLAATELPPDEPRYGRGFSAVADGNNELLRKKLESLKGAEGEPGKAGNYYAACMDEQAIDGRGGDPLKPWLKKVAKVKNSKSLMKLVGELQAKGVTGAPLFSFGPSLDFKDPDLYITDLGQGGTGLPDRSFYLEAQKAPILGMYKQHIARMLPFAGYSPEDAAKAAERVVAFETKLAEISKPRDELRDPEKMYNRLDRKGVLAATKGIDMKGYFKALGYPKVEMINVSVPQFVEGLPKVIGETDAETFRDYLSWHIISSNASELSKEIDDANFQFAAMLTGQKQQKPRWERCVSATTGAMGDVVGKIFVDEAFAGDSKAVATEMITAIEKAFEKNLPNLTWMDDPTRKAAMGKVAKVYNKIGYPEKFKTYEKLEVGEKYFENGLNASVVSFQRRMDKVGTKVDRREWNWPSSIVNASYNPLQNEMNFPAGILQPPFFSREFPKAMNFGAMGMVMGHELTHGFDDQGRKFDGDGVMHRWWSDEVSARFEERAECVGKTYSAIEVQPGTNLNGKLTMGENIADFGGIKETFGAYQAYVADKGAEDAIVDNLTNEQLLFVAYAQAWCSKSTPEIDKLLATLDPHSPPKYRVNVPLAHLPAFWDTFSCGEGTAMRAENVCEVW